MARVKVRRPATEEADRYVVPLEGRPVSRCYFDGRFGICFFSGGPTTEICVGSSMRFTENAHHWIADPEDSSSLTPLLRLFGRRVRTANALKNGALRVEFEDGSLLEVDPDQKFESWEISAEDGLKLVSTPGGGVAFWQSLPEEK